MMGSGTISGPTPDSYGSMLELSWKGEKPVQLDDGTERKFINDFDTSLCGHCKNENTVLDLGKSNQNFCLPNNKPIFYQKIIA